ncbi:MAG: FliM/FliN family flagellar motor switch protein [Myxococcales bacterium]|nr:FliM/FliN family flagellar motor switch protein [Myxococcales bacterium]
MTWPRPLPRPAPVDLTPSPPWDAVNDPALAGRCASQWARALGASIQIEPASPHPGPPPPAAWAAWEGPSGEVGWLAVERRWIHQAFCALTGAPAVAGAAPLSPAEEGVFAWLAGAALDALPVAVTLIGVHGGDPDWPPPQPVGAPSDWRLAGPECAGRARWWVPGAPARPANPRAPSSVPIPLTVQGLTRIDPRRPPAAGDQLPLAEGVALWAGTRRLQALHVSRGRLTVAQEPPFMIPPALEQLPVTLTVTLGELTLSAGQVAALTPGAAVPIQVDDPPVVQLRAGSVPVAQGVLVQAGGSAGLAVQITRVLLDGAG